MIAFALLVIQTFAISSSSGLLTCSNSILGNGSCDLLCLNINNLFDKGDCCLATYIGDGYCDPSCFFESSNWDGGDCSG